MNKQTRKELKVLQERMADFVGRLNNASSWSDIGALPWAELDDIQGEIESILMQEEATLDNTPENLQGSERYEWLDEFVSTANEALELLAFDTDTFADVVELLDDASENIEVDW